MEKMSLTEKEQERQLIEGLIYADRFINRQYLSNIDVHAVQRREENYAQMRLFRLSKLVFDVNENTNDKLISVYGALNSIGATVMIVIRSTASGVEFYVGTRCTQSSTAGSILEQALRGNFAGSEITPLRNAEISRTMHEAILSRENGTAKNVSTVTLVPSMRDQEKENYVQGIEKLIDSMAGRAYTAVLIAEPLGQKMIEEKKRGFEELYATLSPLSETTLAYGKNASYAVANGTFSSFSESINNSVTNSNSETQSETTTTGTSDSTNFGSSSDGSSFGFGISSSYSQSYGTSTSWSRAVTSGETKTDSSGVNQTITNTIGENRTLTVKHVNKSVTDLMEHIDRQLECIRECESFGLWSTSAYFVSEDIQTSVIGASTLRTLLAGDDTQIDRAFINTWDSANSQTVSQVLTSIASGMHPVVHLPRANQYDEQNVKPTVLVSGKELPLFMGLPQRSVPGLVVDHMASFGRAVFNSQARPDAETLELGVVLHKGIRQNVPVSLELEEFRSHCFIMGSTGSGKSNTSYHLLECFAQRQIPFLVVEPAKGEYKFAFGNLPGVNIFWTNPSQYRLLRLNPFSFPDGIHILEHMDRLIEIFNACWPLYSAMPAILKAAVERAYVSCGWDLVRSRRCPVGDRVFPTFADLLRELPRVISESSYSKDTQGDYTGALVTRVSSMTNGIMGSIFCSDYEIEDMVLFDQNTIVDLSRVGASETKALIMGVLVMKLNEYRMSRSHGMNLRLRHITVLEEAHNLLRRTSTAQSSEGANVAGKSVEMISNSIAEMRTYGEGFIIIDQSPTAVDISAIKNTNTKIVMRLPEKNDFETVGNAFALDDEQIREIARLGRGSAIVSQSGWLEPVMVAIHKARDAYEAPFRVPGQEKEAAEVLEQVLHTALRDAFTLSFNERAIRRALREGNLSVNRRDDILNSYATLQRRMLELDEQDNPSKSAEQAETARFIIDVLGCRALADIVPVELRGEDREAAGRAFGRWKQRVLQLLPMYAELEDGELKNRIPRELVIYMAKVQRSQPYMKLLKLLVEGR